MKVTVTFGDTSVVVPCKAGWTVRDLVEQASRRYRRILEQQGGSEMKTHHLEYAEGGILDMDDLLSDLVEDRDKLVAVFQDVQHGRTDSPRETMSNGFSSAAPSPEPYYPHLQYHDPTRGEIEVNEASLKANTPLLVRSSSDSALAPPFEISPTPPPDDRRAGSPDPEISDALKGAQDRLSDDHPSAKMNQVILSTLTRTVNLVGDRGPLGIHVVPYCSSLSGRTLGLHIKGIEANSRSKREGLFQEDECIVQINDVPLQDKTFAQSQEVFRQAMGAPSVSLEVLPTAKKPRYEKSLIGQLFTSDLKDPAQRAKSPMPALSRPDSRTGARSEASRPDPRAKTPEPMLQQDPPTELRTGSGSLERVSPAPPAGEARSSPTLGGPNQADEKNPVMAALANLANKKGSKRIKIDLKKGTEGLGFTVVTRDSSVNGPGPILVKNILPRGAAIKDGRLQPGDRILEVNGVDMTGRSQEELVAMLRSTRQGESVSVVVARQEDIFLPRELKGEDAGSLLLEDGREQLMYEIPLNETGSAGLGVSLKGNKSRETGEDLGIFIKSIIHGGAAYKDGRLNVNDQLIAVNGESLLGRSNHVAMETLRRSMSSEGNARGTIQLVVLRAPRQGQQMGSANAAPNAATSASAARQADSSNQPEDEHHQMQFKDQDVSASSGSSNHPQGGELEANRPDGLSIHVCLDLESHENYQDSYQRPPAGYGPHSSEPLASAAGRTPTPPNGYAYSNSRSAPHPAAATNGGYGHYGGRDEDPEQSFPPPPSPGTVEEMSRELAAPSPPSQRSGYPTFPRQPADVYTNGQFVSDRDNVPRNRASKSMDMVADEGNVGSLAANRREPSSGGTLGPTLGLWKSSSLESLQSAMSEAKHSHVQADVPFHRPRPHMVRGRGCNQSFRIAIDKSYDGPSEDDDDMSEHSSGHETPASSSSRQDLDTVGEKKKTKEKKKKEKKTKKKGFGLLRFGKKKEDKSKDAAKASKSKLEALTEEDRHPDYSDGSDPRYAEVHSGRSGHATPDIEDDDSDPNYARINNFRQPPSPQSYLSRTPSPAGALNPPTDELDGLYAKVNKPRPPPADSDQRLQGPRKEQQQARAAPGYDELDAARRRVLDHDPHRAAPRGPEPRYEEIERPYSTQPRRDPYDYPTHSRPARRDPSPYYNPPASSRAPRDPRAYPQPSQQQHRAAARQDVPPSPGAAQRGRPVYEAAGGRVDAYRQASPGRYDEERQARRKNPLIGAV